MEGVRHKEEGHHENYEASNLALDRVAGVRLLCLLGLGGLEEFEVLHVGGEDGGDGNPGEDAHDWSQYQHETYHHPLRPARDVGHGNEMYALTTTQCQTHCKVDGSYSIEDDEDVLVRQLCEAEIEANCMEGRFQLKFRQILNLKSDSAD